MGTPSHNITYTPVPQAERDRQFGVRLGVAPAGKSSLSSLYITLSAAVTEELAWPPGTYLGLSIGRDEAGQARRVLVRRRQAHEDGRYMRPLRGAAGNRQVVFSLPDLPRRRIVGLQPDWQIRRAADARDNHIEIDISRITASGHVQEPVA